MKNLSVNGISKSIRTMGFVSFFTLIMATSFYCQAQAVDSSSQNIEDKAKDFHGNNRYYLGAKLGAIYIFGIEFNYIHQTKNVKRFYLASSVQTSLIVNSFNAGGGFFLGKSNVGIGCRYHHLLWFESEKESKIQPGYGPEVVWSKTIGTKYIINLHAGGIITKGYFFPDISFGVFLPLNR